MKIITAMKDKIAVLIVILSLVTLSCGGTYSAWAQEIRPATGGVGDTIQEIFPDPNFAQVVATKVAGGNVDAILTQEMVTNCLVLDMEHPSKWQWYYLDPRHYTNACK